MRRSLGARLAAPLAAVLVLAGCSSSDPGTFQFESDGSREIAYPQADRKPVGALSGPSLTTEDTLSLADYPNTVVVLNYWGSWCAPCRAEADELNEASEALADKGVQFLGVDVDEERPAGADFHASMGTPYPSISDPTKRTMLALRGLPTISLPVTIVLDRQHRVAHIWLEPFRESKPLIDTVAAIAAEGQ